MTSPSDTQLPSDTRLKLLRESAEWDLKHGDATVLHPQIVLALVECAEALTAYRNKSDWHDMKKAALAKLEAL